MPASLPPPSVALSLRKGGGGGGKKPPEESRTNFLDLDVASPEVRYTKRYRTTTYRTTYRSMHVIQYLTARRRKNTVPSHIVRCPTVQPSNVRYDKIYGSIYGRVPCEAVEHPIASFSTRPPLYNSLFLCSMTAPFFPHNLLSPARLEFGAWCPRV